MRINVYLAQQLGISRREADRIIAEKKVQLNKKAVALGTQIDPAKDRIVVEGKTIEPKIQKRILVATSRQDM
jgi:23S rRNA pseudouridine2605 synthase